MRRGPEAYHLRRHIAELEERLAEADDTVRALIAGEIDSVSAAQASDVPILLERAQRALAASEARFRALVEKSADGILLLEANGCPLYASPSLEHLLGYSPEELEGRVVVELAYEADSGQVFEAFERSLEQPGVPVQVGFRAWHRAGALRHLEAVFTNRLSDPAVGAVVLNYRDVSERVAAEEALRRSEMLLADAQRIAQLGSFEWTPQSGELLWSDQHYRLLGFEVGSQLSHDEWMQHVHVEDREVVKREFERAVRERSPFQVEYRIVRLDGAVRTLVTQGEPRLDERGELLCLVGSGQDVTERRSLEQQLRQSQKMEAVGLLAGGVAHDFNNLLTAILANTESALSHAQGDNLDELTEIRSAATRAAELIGQLMAFTRRDTALAGPVDLRKLLGGMATLVHRLIGEDIDVKLQLDHGHSCVRAVHGLDQVVLNLVVNARDAMPRGGNLLVRTQIVEIATEQAARLGVGPGRHIVLSVEDSGSGIDPSLQGRVFEPFFTTKEPGRGTGLGLSSAYGIVTQSGGTITVESELGKGTRFDVYLPVASGSAPVESISIAPEALGGVESILLVEDEPVVRRAVRRILHSAGYQVLDAATGREALARCREHGGSIQLLITDVVMPGMSGGELAEQVAATYPHIEVLLMSGYPDDAATQRAVSDRSAAFIQKPFTRGRVLKAVRDVLSRRRRVVSSRAPASARTAAKA